MILQCVCGWMDGWMDEGRHDWRTKHEVYNEYMFDYMHEKLRIHIIYKFVLIGESIVC